MKTYKEHYEECKKAYGDSPVSVYDLTLKSNFLKFDMDNFYEMSRQINKCFTTEQGCHQDNWSIRLNEWQHIEQVENFCQDVMPQIEEVVFGCHLKVEFIHPYKNRQQATNESSWSWHYDDCPREFIKMAIYLKPMGVCR